MTQKTQLDMHKWPVKYQAGRWPLQLSKRSTPGFLRKTPLGSLGVVMANNTERTLRFAFQPSRVPDHQSSQREGCVGVLMFQGKETGLKHVGVKMEVPLPAAYAFGEVTNS